MSFDSKIRPPPGMGEIEEFRERLRASMAQFTSLRAYALTMIIQTVSLSLVVSCAWGLGLSPESALRLGVGLLCLVMLLASVLKAVTIVILAMVATYTDSMVAEINKHRETR